MSNDVFTVDLIRYEVFELLKADGESRLHPSNKILLAVILLADNEGVATLRPKQLQRWCSSRPGGVAGLAFVRGQIAALVERGVLAPGRTELELRSMIGRRAQGVTA